MRLTPQQMQDAENAIRTRLFRKGEILPGDVRLIQQIIARQDDLLTQGKAYLEAARAQRAKDAIVREKAMAFIRAFESHAGGHRPVEVYDPLDELKEALNA